MKELEGSIQLDVHSFKLYSLLNATTAERAVASARLRDKSSTASFLKESNLMPDYTFRTNFIVVHTKCGKKCIVFISRLRDTCSATCAYVYALIAYYTNDVQV